METIRISRQLISAVLPSLFGGTSGFNFLNVGSAQPGTFIRVYSGTPPTAAQLASFVMDTSKVFDVDALVTSLGGQVLWTGYYFGTGTVTITDNVIRTTDTPYIAATGAGLATWFLLGIAPGLTSAAARITSTSVIRQCLMGSVSNGAGTGDLKLTDPNIVVGNQYRAAAFSISVPMDSSF